MNNSPGLVYLFKVFFFFNVLILDWSSTVIPSDLTGYTGLGLVGG